MKRVLGDMPVRKRPERHEVPTIGLVERIRQLAETYPDEDPAVIVGLAELDAGDSYDFDEVMAEARETIRTRSLKP